MSWNFDRTAVIQDKLAVIDHYMGHRNQITGMSNKESRRFVKELLDGDSRRWDGDHALIKITYLRGYRDYFRFLDLDHRAIKIAVDLFITQARRTR
jgi:hypothetical protein